MHQPQQRAKRIACVWLPNWPIQRVTCEQTQLVDQPLILAQRDSRRGMIVVAASRDVRAAGVRPLMRLSEATALTPATILEHDPDEDIEAICGLAEAMQIFSPLVGLEQLDKHPWAGKTLQIPESILLDVSGVARLFGSEQQLVNSLCGMLYERRLFACVALASSVGAAWALANYALRSDSANTYIPADPDEADVPHNAPQQPEPAPAATDTVNPDAIYRKNNTDDSYLNSPATKSAAQPSRYFVSPTGTDDTNTLELPLAALRIEPGIVDSLNRLGVRTIAQLTSLPRTGIVNRFGEKLLLRWDQLLGKKSEPVVSLVEQTDWSVEKNLEYPTDDTAILGEAIRGLCLPLTARLAKRSYGALRIVCRLEQLDALPLIMQLGLFRPSNDAAHLQLLLVGQLEQQLGRQAIAPIEKLVLQATLVGPLIWTQGDLFEECAITHRQQIASLVDSLSARLGRKRVLSAKLHRESQPEIAFTLHPMTGRRTDGTEQNAGRKLSSRLATRRAEPARTDPLRRPTKLLPTPVPISRRRLPKPPVTTWQASSDIDAGEATINRNWQFRYLSNWHTVVDSLGPERLESGWWRGPSCRRDYYRLVTSDGSWWWVFRDMTNNQWFLHGQFD